MLGSIDFEATAIAVLSRKLFVAYSGRGADPNQARITSETGLLEKM